MTCSVDPTRQVVLAMGEVISGLKTMRLCGRMVGDDATGRMAKARRKVERMEVNITDMFVGYSAWILVVV